MIAFDQYNYCVFFGVNFSYSKSPTERLPYAEDFPFERVFCRYSKQLHQLSKVPNEYLLYCLSSQSQKPPPVYHFFPKISLSFSCFLLRIPYTLPRKSNKNLKSDFYLSSPFWWTDKPSMNIWRKYLTARSQPTSISLKNSEFIQG